MASKQGPFSHFHVLRPHLLLLPPPADPNLHQIEITSCSFACFPLPPPRPLLWEPRSRRDACKDIVASTCSWQSTCIKIVIIKRGLPSPGDITQTGVCVQSSWVCHHTTLLLVKRVEESWDVHNCACKMHKSRPRLLNSTTKVFNTQDRDTHAKT